MPGPTVSGNVRARVTRAVSHSPVSSPSTSLDVEPGADDHVTQWLLAPLGEPPSREVVVGEPTTLRPSPQ